MKPNHQLWLLAASAMLIASCKKNDNGTVVPTAKTKDKYLTQVIRVETHPGTVTTTTITNYTYDDKKRLTEIKSPDALTEYMYYDNGDLFSINKLSLKIAGTNEYGARTDAELFYSQGKIQAADVKNYKNDEILNEGLYNYVYDGERVSEVHYDNRHVTLYDYDDHGNVVKEVIRDAIPSVNYYVYDDKKSAFTPTLFKCPNKIEDRSSPNNVISITNITGSTTTNTTISYTYDSDGYPTTAISGTATDGIKSTYKYSKLE
jgi:YD repeat-containing protein